MKPNQKASIILTLMSQRKTVGELAKQFNISEEDIIEWRGEVEWNFSRLFSEEDIIYSLEKYQNKLFFRIRDNLSGNIVPDFQYEIFDMDTNISARMGFFKNLKTPLLEDLEEREEEINEQLKIIREIQKEPDLSLNMKNYLLTVEYQNRLLLNNLKHIKHYNDYLYLINHFKELLAEVCHHVAASEKQFRKIADGIKDNEYYSQEMKYFLLGYVWRLYANCCSNREECLFKAKNFLLQAIELEPENRYSWYYLGVVHYQLSYYEEAFEALKKIPLNYFKESDKYQNIVRDLKIKELFLCLSFKLEDTIKPLAFLDEYYEFKKDKLMGGFYPHRLYYECLDFAKKNNYQFGNSIMPLIDKFIDDFGDIEYLEDESKEALNLLKRYKEEIEINFRSVFC